MTEQELRQIEAAIRSAVTDHLERGRLIATVRSATANLIAPPERPGEKHQREREAAGALMREGCTPRIAARRLASDPHDPDEITRLSQRFRDHRRRAKRNAESA